MKWRIKEIFIDNYIISPLIGVNRNDSRSRYLFPRICPQGNKEIKDSIQSVDRKLDTFQKDVDQKLDNLEKDFDQKLETLHKLVVG